MAKVYKRGKVYWGRVQHRNRDLRKSLFTDSRGEALKRLAEWVGKLRARDSDGKPRMTYAEAMGRFDEEHIEGLKPQTAKRYRVSIKALHGGFKGVFLDEVNKTRIADYAAQRRRAGISGAAVRHDLAVLGSMLRYAVNSGWIVHNIARDFDKRSIPQANKRERYFSDEELQKLYDGCQPDLLRIVAFAVETGMRLGEILSLRYQDIDRGRMEARLWDQRTKNKTSRTVPLSEKALAQVGSGAGTGHVFGLAGGKRRREDNISRRFWRLCRRAGVTDGTFHDLRHTFASRALQGKFEWQRAPFDIPRLQKWIGHKTITQTMRYAHLASDDLHALIRRPAKRRHTSRDMTKESKRAKVLNPLVAAEGFEPPTKGL